MYPSFTQQCSVCPVSQYKLNESSIKLKCTYPAFVTVRLYHLLMLSLDADSSRMIHFWSENGAGLVLLFTIRPFTTHRTFEMAQFIQHTR